MQLLFRAGMNSGENLLASPRHGHLSLEHTCSVDKASSKKRRSSSSSGSKFFVSFPHFLGTNLLFLYQTSPLATIAYLEKTRLSAHRCFNGELGMRLHLDADRESAVLMETDGQAQ
ncbi:hypothetical protein Ciccas_008521 [Cichlidogyrus casuarinus]|uniref:Uncharacterized protein n=1 Tax=Cichlidogyrus casuarinus TaxID=1844966 RepID=A0ABD2Q181_9PLAT